MGKGTRLKQARKAARERAALRVAATLARGDDPRSIILAVETASGVYYRRIAPARPLARHLKPGTAAEEATHSAVTQWGLPDFMFRATIEQVGPGVREKGDGFIVVGNWGVLLQVKHRENPSEDQDKEARWLHKSIYRGVKQARGSVRRLRMAPVVATSARGREAVLDLREIDWISVVVVDHEKIPPHFSVDAEISESSLPTVIITRQDWEFLFEQLKSTYAVVQYLRRVADETGTDLEGEHSRYYELASADARARGSKRDPRFTGVNAQYASFPLLPQPPAGHGEPDELRAFNMTRILLEDVAVMDNWDSKDVDELHRIRLLSEIDSLPLAYRVEIGRTLETWLDEAREVDKEDVRMRSRRIVDPDSGRQLAFVAASKFSPYAFELFKNWSLAKHRECAETLGGFQDHFLTTTVVLSARFDDIRMWDTTTIHIAGDPGLPPEDWALIENFLSYGRVI